MTRGRRPSIGHIGTVHDDGRTVTISGWQLGLCAARCNCHRHPVTHQLAVDDAPAGYHDTRSPALGLTRYGGPCDCCQPWTADELTAILRDLADVQTLETTA